MRHYFALFICLFLIAGLGTTQNTVPEDFDVQGHRGARGLKPENTLPSIETALDLGVTTIELDLHFTADNAVVVWHDAAIDLDLCRLPDGVTLDLPENNSLIFRSSPRRLRILTLEQVQSFQCDLNPNTFRFPDQTNTSTALAGDDYHIPTLAEVFEFVEAYANSGEKTPEQRANAAQVRFNLESKRQANRPDVINDDFDGENIAPFELAILEVIDTFELVERVIIQSFDHRVLVAIHNIRPDITLAALTNRQRPRFDFYVENGFSVWSPNYENLTADLLQDAHDLGLRVIPWTINEVDVMQALMVLGVDGIITDRPDLLLNLLLAD